MNGVQKPSSENLKLLIHASGKINLEERLVVKLSTNFALEKFPFDTQTLPIILESFTSNADKLKLVVNQELSVIDEYVKLLEWKMTGKTAEVQNHSYNLEGDQDEFSRYSFVIDIERKAGFYLWKIILPLSLIIIIACFLFWTTLHTDKFATVGFTLMLTVVAFNFSISTLLPKVSYITLMDAVVIMSYMVIFVFILTREKVMRGFMRFMSIGLPSLYVSTCA